MRTANKRVSSASGRAFNMSQKLSDMEETLQKNAEAHQQKVAAIEAQVQVLVTDLEGVTAKYECASDEQQRLVDEVLALEESLAIEQNHAEKLEWELTNALSVTD